MVDAPDDDNIENQDSANDLVSLDTDANKDQTKDEKVKTESLGSGNGPVRGTSDDTIQSIDLEGPENSKTVDTLIQQALKFKPLNSIYKKPESLLNTLRQDFNNIASYVAVRKIIESRVSRVVNSRFSRSQRVDMRAKIISEKLSDFRIKKITDRLDRQLLVTKNLLKFQRTVATTYMQQGLSLQYKSLFATKDLVKVTKAFAIMSENKLNAIKINTSLPEKKKETTFDRIKKRVKKEFITKLPEALSKNTLKEAIGVYTDPYIKQIKAMSKDIGFLNRDNRLTRTFKSINNYKDSIVKKIDEKLPDYVNPRKLWEKNPGTLSSLQKGSVELKKFLYPEPVLPKELVELKAINTHLKELTEKIGGRSPGVSEGTSGQKQISEIVSLSSSSLDHIKKFYSETNEKKQKLLESMNSSLIKIQEDIKKGLIHNHYYDGSQGNNNGPSNDKTTSKKLPSFPFHVVANWKKKISSFIPGFTKQEKLKDIYVRDEVDPGHPVITKDQLINKEVVRSDGKPIKAIKDITVPLINAKTGDVVLSEDDIKKGLVDINNKSLSAKKTTFERKAFSLLGRLTFGTFRALYINPAKKILDKVTKLKFVDVYLKDKVKPGHPLVAAKRFKEGLVFSNGKVVHDVYDIKLPVLDPATGETLISEEDIKHGLVDVFNKKLTGKPISIATPFRLLGKGIGFAASALFGTAKFAASMGKPFINLYTQVFSTMSKTVLGVGGFLSKSILSLLSGKAPAAAIKGIFGIAGGLTKMYGSMFGLGLKALGGASSFLFKDLLGFGSWRNKGKSDVTKKDIYKLVSQRLDNIYNLLEHRLKKPVRKNSYQDQENKLKAAKDKLLHLEEAEGLPLSGFGAVGGMVGGLFGKIKSLIPGLNNNDSDTDKSGGLVNDAESAAEGAVAAKVLSKGKSLAAATTKKTVSGVKKVTKKVLGSKSTAKTIKDTAEVADKADTASAADDVAKHIIKRMDKAKPKSWFSRLFGESKDTVKDAAATTKKAAKVEKAASTTSKAAKALSTGAEAGAEAGAEIGVKAGAKVGGKLILKSIPLLGTAISEGIAADDLYHGDYVGAAGNAASGIVSLFPIIGTAVSFGIDSWLAWRSLTEGSQQTLLKTRLKVYGVSKTQTKIIKSLEKDVLKIIITKSNTGLTPAQLQGYAKEFGFDPTKPDQVLFFSNWADTRFKLGYYIFLATLKELGFNPSLNGGDVKDFQVNKVVSTYTTNVTSKIQPYQTLVPTMEAFKNSSANDVVPIPTSDSSNPLTKSSISIPTLASLNKQNGKTKNTPPPKYKGAYTPSTENRANYQLTSYDAGDVNPDADMSLTQGINGSNASISQTTYNPSAPANSNEYTPFKPKGGPSSTVVAAATAAMQKATATTNGKIPVGPPYFDVMNQTLLAAATAAKVPHPDVIAKLGAAQSSLETGWGRHIPNGNAFGIKATAAGSGASESTQEVINGQTITENQNFRTYGSIAQSAADYVNFLEVNGRYKPVLSSANINQAIAAQSHTGYATDPNYGQKLAEIVNRAGGLFKNGRIPISANQEYASFEQGGSDFVQTAGSYGGITAGGAAAASALLNGPALSYQNINIPSLANLNSSQSMGQAAATRTPIGSSPMSSSTSVSIPVYNQNQLNKDNQSPIGLYTQPAKNTIAQVQEQNENVQQSVISTPKPVVPEALPVHPQLLNAFTSMSGLQQQTNTQLQTMSQTLNNLFGHFKDVHGPSGLFGEMANNLSTPQTTTNNTTIAPITTIAQNTTSNSDSLGFSVSKKRDVRYQA